MRLFRVDVGDTVRSGGIPTYEQDGESVEVNGKPMVALRHGSIVPRGDEWCESISEAKEEAADRLEQIANRIMRQSIVIREEARHAR